MWFIYLLLFLAAVVLVAAVAALYLGYVAAAGILAAAVAVAAYSLGLPAAYLAGLSEVLAIRPDGLSRPATWPQPPEGADPAVLQYFYGPAMADAAHSTAVAYGRCQDLWSRGASAVRSSLRAEVLAATVPLGIGGAVGMVVGVAAGTVAAGGCALVYLVIVALCTAAVRATGAVLRGADSALLRMRNIRIVCPRCGERVPYPGYICPGATCTRRHKDVRPGRLGVIRRNCHCGMPMSTLLLFGSASMSAFCPHCGESLEHRPGEAPEIVLAFFGATGAGKTRLVSALVTQLVTWARAGRLTAGPGDAATVRGLDEAEHLLSSGRATALPPVQLPRALVVRVSSGKVTRILHLFDAAGEHFRDAERTGELRYLSEARTFILVIDPLTIEAFRLRLPTRRRAEPAGQRAADSSPDQAYHQTYQQIEAMGVQLREARLAVAFSRADLMDVPDGEATEWARHELGLSNLIISASQNFREARFFRTAAVIAADGTVHESVAVLLNWVLADSRLTLPGEGKG